jgi:hypothetical protein
MEQNGGFNYKELRRKEQKFVRYKEGSQLYSMGMSKFQEIAKKAGAVYKVNQMVLVNTDILDAYLEGFRLREENDDGK